jgi:hypothetical protein
MQIKTTISHQIHFISSNIDPYICLCKNMCVVIISYLCLSFWEALSLTPSYLILRSRRPTYSGGIPWDSNLAFSFLERDQIGNMNDLVSEYQQYQDATAEEEGEFLSLVSHIVVTPNTNSLFCGRDELDSVGSSGFHCRCCGQCRFDNPNLAKYPSGAASRPPRDVLDSLGFSKGNPTPTTAVCKGIQSCRQQSPSRFFQKQ